MRVVLSADGADRATAASDWCCAHLERGSTVIAVLGLAHVTEIAGSVVGLAPFNQLGGDAGLLAAIQRDCCERFTASGLQCQARILPEPQGAALIDVATTEHADLIVVGKRPHGWLADAVLGDAAAHIVHHPPCPVVVVPTRNDDRVDDHARG